MKLLSPFTGDEPDPTTEETNETEEPVDPDPIEPDENTILCFCEYLSSVSKRSGKSPELKIRVTGYASNGLKFEGWIDQSTQMIKSFYPVIDE